MSYKILHIPSGEYVSSFDLDSYLEAAISSLATKVNNSNVSIIPNRLGKSLLTKQLVFAKAYGASRSYITKEIEANKFDFIVPFTFDSKTKARNFLKHAYYTLPCNFTDKSLKNFIFIEEFEDGD